MRTDIGADRRSTIGKRKDADRSGIDTEITGIVHSSFIAGRRISSFLLSEIALSATVMIGMTGPIGATMMMIGGLMGRLEEGCPFMIDWGAGLVRTTSLAIVFNTFLGTRKSLKKWLMRGFLMSSFFAEMPILTRWSQGRIVAHR